MHTNYRRRNRYKNEDGWTHKKCIRKIVEGQMRAKVRDSLRRGYEDAPHGPHMRLAVYLSAWWN